MLPYIFKHTIDSPIIASDDPGVISSFVPAARTCSMPRYHTGINNAGTLHAGITGFNIFRTEYSGRVFALFACFIKILDGLLCKAVVDQCFVGCLLLQLAGLLHNFLQQFQ